MMGSFFLVAAAGVGLFVRLLNDRNGFIRAWLRVFYCMFYLGCFFQNQSGCHTTGRLFFLMAGPFRLLLLRGQREKAERGIAYTCTVFYLMYLFYLFFPVMELKHYIPELRAMWYTNFDGLLFTSIMKAVFARKELSGAAFPSTHAAITVLSLWECWKNRSFAFPFSLIEFSPARAAPDFQAK